MKEGTCVDFPLEEAVRKSENTFTHDLPAGLATEY